MMYIPLTQGQVAKVDDADFPFISQWKWCAQFDPKRGNYHAKRGLYVDGSVKALIMHRVLLEAPPHLQVDHINFDTLDNRRINLRLCTPAENRRHRRVQHRTSSGIKGVYLDKVTRRWGAIITVDKHTINLGCFSTTEEAALAYNDAAIKYHKEFASLTIIKKEEYAHG